MLSPVLLRQLYRGSSGPCSDVCNPYCDEDPALDQPGASRQRRRNLEAYRARANAAAERWRAFLGRFRRIPARPSIPDPILWKTWAASRASRAREAVLATYRAFLSACARLGHPRPERSTPYEFLHALPPGLRPCKARPAP